MVADDAAAQHGGLGGQLWVELHAAELRCGRLQGGLGQVEPRGARELVGWCGENGFGDEQEVAEIPDTASSPFGELVQDLLVLLDDALQPLLEVVVLAAYGDAVGDGLADLLGH